MKSNNNAYIAYIHELMTLKQLTSTLDIHYAKRILQVNMKYKTSSKATAAFKFSHNIIILIFRFKN